jgi:SHS2 domain-containing protein
MGKIDKIEMQKKNEVFNLSVIVSGEDIKENVHHLKVEIKAVTFHQMEIKRINNKYFTRIIFDI